MPNNGVCPLCSGMGFIMPDLRYGDPGFGIAVPCECKREARAARKISQRNAHLLRIDGLTEEDRAHDLADFQIQPGQEAAYAATMEAIERRAGILTFTGQWGVGKTELLIGAVNKLRSLGVPSVYMRTAAMLDWIRQAYNPYKETYSEDEDLSAAERWDLLTKVEFLALDELEKFKSTPWAMERFSWLIDERWHRMDRCMTFIATNAPISRFPADVRSRLKDGRARIVEVGGLDMREFNEWEEGQE